MTKRAEQALRGLYDPAANQAIGKLVEFAAQNPGLEFGNYGEWGAYNSERQSITRDWKNFVKALQAASDAGVTDKDVIEVAPRAFSGRLEWKQAHRSIDANGSTFPKDSHWDYCTGQYFPTEYRKAATVVLEYATREHLRSMPKVSRPTIETIAQLKELNRMNGGCWFGKGEMAFFGTRIESGILHEWYFITSEQQDHDRPRKFTVRSFDDKGSVDTVGEFHSHRTKADAIEALNQHLTHQPTAGD